MAKTKRKFSLGSGKTQTQKADWPANTKMLVTVQDGGVRRPEAGTHVWVVGPGTGGLLVRDGGGNQHLMSPTHLCRLGLDQTER